MALNFSSKCRNCRSGPRDLEKFPQALVYTHQGFVPYPLAYTIPGNVQSHSPEYIDITPIFENRGKMGQIESKRFSNQQMVSEIAIALELLDTVLG